MYTPDAQQSYHRHRVGRRQRPRREVLPQPRFSQRCEANPKGRRSPSWERLARYSVQTWEGSSDTDGRTGSPKSFRDGRSYISGLRQNNFAGRPRGNHRTLKRQRCESSPNVVPTDQLGVRVLPRGFRVGRAENELMLLRNQ